MPQFIVLKELKEKKPIVVIDDFHYIPEITQREIIFNQGHQPQAYYLVIGNPNTLVWFTAEHNEPIELPPDGQRVLQFNILPGSSKFT